MKTQEQRDKHAAYMREWYKRKPGYKSSADRKHREKHRDKLIAYDRQRNEDPQRRENKRAWGERWRAEHAEEKKIYDRQFYLDHKERWKVYNGKPERKTYMSSYLRCYGLKRNYGITEDQYNDMFDRQGGVCALCKCPPSGKSLHVDHNHETNQIRGLLCTLCNHALERLESYPGWGHAAEHYLHITAHLPKVAGR